MSPARGYVAAISTRITAIATPTTPARQCDAPSRPLALSRDSVRANHAFSAKVLSSSLAMRSDPTARIARNGYSS